MADKNCTDNAPVEVPRVPDYSERSEPWTTNDKIHAWQLAGFTILLLWCIALTAAVLELLLR